MTIIQEIRCKNCGGPIKFNPGEIIATCQYCGFTSVIETGRSFTFEHSMFVNKYDSAQIEELIRNWMRSGFLKPRNLAKSSKIHEKNLTYIPFWIIPVTAVSKYKGIFERLSPPIVKKEEIDKRYDWLVLARKVAEFPTREYDLPLEGKINYDFRKIEVLAKVLNSEISREEAMEIARQQVKSHHEFLAKQDVDKIIEMEHKISFGNSIYLHAPIWFIIYEYKGEQFRVILDGATGMVIKGDIPTTQFGIL